MLIKILYQITALILFIVGVTLIAGAVRAEDVSDTRQFPKKIFLYVGDTKVLELLEGADLKLSQKGIVDVYSMGEGRWQITGLRSGFVIVDYSDEDGNGGRLFVEIGKKEKVMNKKDASSNNFPVGLCSQRGIICDEDLDIIEGATDSFALWQKIKSECENSEKCFFNVELSKVGQEKFKKILERRLGGNLEIRFSEFGLPYVFAFCKKGDKLHDWINYAFSNGIDDSYIKIICRNSISDQKYLLDAKIVLIERMAASQAGLDFIPKRKGKTVGQPIIESHQLLLVLKSLESSRKAKVIAQPILHLNPGVEASIHSGGEFQVIYNTGESKNPEKEGWKKVGLELKAKLENFSEEFCRLWFDFSIKNRSASFDGRFLQSSNISSELDIKLGEPIIAAGADFEAEQNMYQSNLSFGDIPILGPLFRLAGKEKNKSRLLLWLMVTKNENFKDVSDFFEHSKNFKNLEDEHK